MSDMEKMKSIISFVLIFSQWIQSTGIAVYNITNLMYYSLMSHYNILLAEIYRLNATIPGDRKDGTTRQIQLHLLYDSDNCPAINLTSCDTFNDLNLMPGIIISYNYQ